MELVLELGTSSKTVSGVSVVDSAATLVEGNSVTLTNVGAGIRKKSFIVKVKVYVAQLLVSQPESFVRTQAGALDSIDDMDVSAIRLTFVRNVDADAIAEAFEESLESNEIDIDAREYQEFSEAVLNSGKASAGKDMVIMGAKLSDGREMVVFEDNKKNGTKIFGPSGFIKSIFSMWLGVTTDDELEKLKKQLIGA